MNNEQRKKVYDYTVSSDVSKAFETIKGLANDFQTAVAEFTGYILKIRKHIDESDESDLDIEQIGDEMAEQHILVSRTYCEIISLEQVLDKDLVKNVKELYDLTLNLIKPFGLTAGIRSSKEKS